MGTKTKIEWCDATFNPWRGCTKISTGCANCYADQLSHRNPSVLGKWGPKGMRVVASETYWKMPIKWNADAARLIHIDDDGREWNRPRVFCASLADVFEEWRGPIVDANGHPLYTINGAEWFSEGEYPECRAVTLDDVRARLFRLIDATPNLDWLLLTKRPENIRCNWLCPMDTDGDGNCHQCSRGLMHYRRNVWLGTSVENQETAEERVPELLKCRELSPVLFLSCEPLLGPIDLIELAVSKRVRDALPLSHPGFSRAIDWVIVGGESGGSARPMHPEWAKSIRDQCSGAGVPFFFKQWGEFIERPTPARASDSKEPPVAYRPGCDDPLPYGWVERIGKKNAGRLLDGIEHSEFPKTSTT